MKVIYLNLIFFKSRTNLNFFRPYFHYCSSSVYYCENHFRIHVFICRFQLYVTLNNSFTFQWLNYAVSGFLHCEKLICSLQLITVILALFQSEQRFCFFVAELRFLAFFLHRETFLPVAANHTQSIYSISLKAMLLLSSRLITLFSASWHQERVFVCLQLN